MIEEECGNRCALSRGAIGLNRMVWLTCRRQERRETRRMDAMGEAMECRGDGERKENIINMLLLNTSTTTPSM